MGMPLLAKIFLAFSREICENGRKQMDEYGEGIHEQTGFAASGIRI